MTTNTNRNVAEHEHRKFMAREVASEIRRLPLAQCPTCRGFRKDAPRVGWSCWTEHAAI